MKRKVDLLPIFIRLVVFAVTAAMAVLIACCGKSDSGYQISDKPYQDWHRKTVGKVTIIYPEGHLHSAEMESIASGYEKAQKQICDFFSIPIPPDSIYVYYYTGLGQGREMTGHEWVFADSNHLHFWMPSYLGVALMEYLLPKWVPEEPKFYFLKPGLLALFDFSGNNYHESVLNFVDRDIFISLDSLSRDTSLNVNSERYATAEAASFISSFVANYGMESFKQLYQAQDDFSAAINRETGLEVDSLQTLWLKFARDEYDKLLDSSG